MKTKKNNIYNIYLVLSIIILNFAFNVSATNIIISKNTQNETIIKENNYYEFNFSNKLASFDYNNINTKNAIFTELSVPGYGSSFAYGNPNLPVLYKLIEVPINAEIKININSSTFIDYDLKTIGINNLIYPVQPPIAKSNTDEVPFIINNNVYSKNEFIQNEIISIELLGIMRGIRLARISISPFKYNPVSGVLRVYNDLDVSLIFKNPDIIKTQEMKKLNSFPYFNSFNNKIFNFKQSFPHKDYIVTTPVKYVIVSPIAYQATLQPFIEWKTKKGFTVIEAYTNDPLVGTTNVSIKNYLKNLYNAGTPSDPPPSFVLFVGDVDQIPSFNGTTGTHVTDLYYCEYTNDFLPEVYYGRFSCTGINDLQPQIDKTLEYEQYLMPDDSFLNEVVMISGHDYSMASTYGNGQVNYGTSTYFNSSNGITSHTYLYPSPSGAAAQIIQDVSNGCGFVNYTAHGSSSGWVNPAFNVSDVAGLQNTNKYPLMIGNACQTNRFNDAVCFGEALLRAENKGALGYIGASNNTYWSEDYYWSVGAKTVVVNPLYDANALGAYDRLFHTNGEAYEEWYITQGQIIFAGNISVMELSSSYDYYWEIYHLMGDPSLMVYFSVPPQLNCTYTPLIILGTNAFTVNTEPYAYVAVSSNGILHGAALADATGVADINITPFTVSTIVDIVATKQNSKPFFGTVAAASPTGPYVVLETKSIDDVIGNNNGIPEANENISISVSLKNYGITDATNVNTILTSSDPYINITDNNEFFGDISTGSSINLNNCFTFTVANNIPDKHIIDFDLSINDNNSNVWNSSFSLTAHAPNLLAGGLIIDDMVGGNNNKRLDPGETIVLMIKTDNIGLSDASSTNGTLSSNSPNIIINNGVSNIGTIIAGSYSYAVFNISVSSSAIAGEIVDFLYNANSGQYTTQETYNTLIGIVTEDWETGDFNKFNWVKSGDLPWFTNNSDAYEGLYCIQSGAIDNQQSSVISISATVTSDDSISFYRKVSSEASYDFLKFYIDNVMIKSWSGNANWERFSFPVASGSRIFKWEYVKDYSMSAGSDAAWIDFIQFPPCIISSVATISESLSNVSESFVCYPNPVSNKGNINFNINKSNNISIVIYNNIGQKVKTVLPTTNIISGDYNYEFDISSFKNGFYYVVLKTDNEIITRKISVIK